MTTIPDPTQFEQFRQAVYHSFPVRADAAFELLDALCSYRPAQSPVELSLSPFFQRGHSSLYKAVSEVPWPQIDSARLLSRTGGLPRPQARPFWLLAIDVTSNPRPFAPTLSDRGYVYAPNAVAGNKPVTVGHQYSSVVLLPEAQAERSASWVVPLASGRVASDADKELVGAQQVSQLLSDGEAALVRGIGGRSRRQQLQ